MKFGEYLVQESKLNKDQLKEALSMQVDNPNLKLGEIFVSLEYLSASELLGSIEAYVKQTGVELDQVTEWLTQKEVDELVAKLKAES